MRFDGCHVNEMKELDELLRRCAARHSRLCPRQVLGARMGGYAGDLLGLELPQSDKRLLVIVETDGCAADGVAEATGCSVGRRTLRVQDYGKVAAVFVDTETGRAVRIAPRHDARVMARDYAPQTCERWEAQLVGYQLMPDDLLLIYQWVELTTPIELIIGRAGVRVPCQQCGEEIMNGRQVVCHDKTLCQSCAGSSYYHSLAAEIAQADRLNNLFPETEGSLCR